MDHQLENLGPERFQQLCQALFAKEFPGVNCLPVAQPDGGRDAVRYPEAGDTGFTVYQVKYARVPEEGENARKWVRDVTDGEIDKVKRLIERGANRYLLATNVSGTAHLEIGSIDKLQLELSDKFGVPVLCWWRDDINRRLDGSWDIKLRYPEVLSGSDFFHLLLETTAGQETERRLRTLRAFLAEQYSEDVEVKFKQVELQNKLLDLFVDLPFKLVIRSQKSRDDRFVTSIPFPVRLFRDTPGTIIIEDIYEAASGAGTASLLLSEFSVEQINQVVVEGAPGQGKSTLAQYICQVHRIRLLEKEEDLQKVPEHHRHTALRIPFKVDLSDLAVWLGGADPFAGTDSSSRVPEPRSLESFLAHLVRHHSGGMQFDINDLLEVSKLAPLLVVLDGLDEVADIRRRADIVAAVSKAIPRIQENCKHLQVVITSRPAAFANSPGFDRDQYPHLQLGSVRRAQIQLYANRWMDVRALSRRERAEFQSILNEKLDEPHLRDLARNPMQLTILLSLIHTEGAALPDKRTSLYDEYVRLFFSREAAKNVAVRQHIELLKDIHGYLGWILHAAAETGRNRTGGRISAKDLKDTLEIYLRREQHSTAVVDEVFGAMLERVVMIVPRIQGTYEFEVQPLREYFAARYLYDTASYSPPGKEKTGTKPDRFDAIARNFYWLNVVRFFSGCFSKGELLDLADRIKDLIGDIALGRSRHPVTLGAMLLADWVFTQSPKAVAEVAGALSTRDALRRLLPDTMTYRGEQTIQIPARCGGSEIVLKAFEFLEEKHTRKDLGRRLAAFISANATSQEIDARWLAMAQGSVAGDPTRWLWIGSELGSLSRTDKIAIMAIVGDGPLAPSDLSILCEAGRYDCVLTSDVNAASMRSYVLSRPSSRSHSNAGAGPLYLLPVLLSWEFLGIGRGRFATNEFSEAVQRFKSEVQSIPQSELLFRFDFRQETFDLSRKIAALLDEEGADGLSVMTWQNLIEDCRILWGEQPAILAAANAITDLRPTIRTRRKQTDLLDRNQPICSRARFAKSQAKNLSWWRSQLAEVKDENDKLVYHMSYWNFVSLDIIFDMVDELTASLESMSLEKWSTLLNFIHLIIEPGHHYYYVSGHSRTNANQPLPRQLGSPRLALLVGIKDRATYGRSIFLDYLMHVGPQHTVFSEFRQSQAFEAALAEALDWRVALSIIRSTYSEGAAYHLARVSRSRQQAVILPETVSQQILGNAKDYPIHLWELAENIASANARKAIRPVATVAKKERWFRE